MEENSKKVFVIPHNEKFPIFERYCLEHKQGIMNYIIDYQIETKPINFYLVDSIELSFELSLLNNLIILYDEYKGNKELIVIIPNEVSNNQIEYLNNIKSILANSNLMLYLLNKDNNWIPIDKTNTNIKITDLLNQELKERLKDNKKLIKKKNCQDKKS